MKIVVAVAALFAGACCTSLPRMPEKKLAFPSRAPELESVAETREVWRDDKRDRDVPVTIYGQRGPVVVFSHGIGEDRDAYAYLGRALARHGYRAVHVTHAGTDRAVLERGYRHLYRAVKQKENWVNRPLDVSFVLDRLEVEARQSCLATSTGRIACPPLEAAIIGHSAGAFTAFAVAGLRMAEGTLRDPRIKVAIPMSMPRMDGVVPPGGYDAIDVPTLNVTGTCDASLIYRTFPRHRRIPFEQSRAPRQYLVTMQGVNHDTFVVDDPKNAQIAALTIAFLDAWLRADAAARAWFDEPGRGSIGAVRLSVERKTEGAR